MRGECAWAERYMVPNDGLMVCFKCLRPTQMVFYKVQQENLSKVEDTSSFFEYFEGWLLFRFLCAQSKLYCRSFTYSYTQRQILIILSSFWSLSFDLLLSSLKRAGGGGGTRSGIF